ncbi:MAG: cation transporter [Oscillospiraceae bacterium]|nr:cation transporter [Oscillospiraceae bacterium]
MTNRKNRRDAFKSQQRVAVLNLIREVSQLAATIAVVVASGSLVMALDAVQSMSAIIQSGLTALLSKKLRQDDRFKYDYGMGKIEALGSFVFASVYYVGLASVFAASVYSLMVPRKPETILFVAILMKSAQVLVDLYMLRKQSKIAKAISGHFVDANMLFIKDGLIFNSIILSAVTICFFFRGAPLAVYFEPAVCVIFAVLIAFKNAKIIKAASLDLLDRTLDEETQLTILRHVSPIWDDIHTFHGVRTRRSGHIIYIDLLVSFSDDKSYAEIRKAYEAFDRAMKEELPDSVTAMVIGNLNDHEMEG